MDKFYSIRQQIVKDSSTFRSWQKSPVL